MRMVSPRTGAEEITVAENQPEFRPVVAALYRDPTRDPASPAAYTLLSRWSFTPEERQRIAGCAPGQRKYTDEQLSIIVSGTPGLEDLVDEIRRLYACVQGEDLYVAHEGVPMQPFSPQVGPEGWIVVPGVEVTPETGTSNVMVKLAPRDGTVAVRVWVRRGAPPRVDDAVHLALECTDLPHVYSIEAVPGHWYYYVIRGYTDEAMRMERWTVSGNLQTWTPST